MRIVLGQFGTEVFERIGACLGGVEGASNVVVEVAWGGGGGGVGGAVEGGAVHGFLIERGMCRMWARGWKSGISRVKIYFCLWGISIFGVGEGVFHDKYSTTTYLPRSLCVLLTTYF